MKKILLLFTLCFSLFSFAQYETTIKAELLDKKTNQPIAYANIGFFEKSIGTVSDANGEFQLIYRDELIGNIDKLYISALGYQTLKVSKKQFERYLVNNNKIYLQPEPLALDEVVISNNKKTQIRLGSSDNNTNMMGYWKDKKALGGEIATQLKIKNANTKLIDLKFNVIENASDSLKIRVNIYDYKKGLVGENLLKKNVYHTISIKKGLETIDLESHNIYVDKDIIVGIELIEVYGENIGFAISAKKEYKGNSYTKYISQDKWKRIKSTAMAFSILCERSLREGEVIELSREIPKKVTIYWDNSLSMVDRDHNLELELLNSYIKKIKNLDIEIVTFNIKSNKPKQFTVKNGKSKEVINYLKSINYNGGTSFSEILKANTFDSKVILLFTDGNSNFKPLESEINTPVFSINSNDKANHFALQKSAFHADGHYINLSKTSIKNALKLMLNKVEDYETYSQDSNQINISGRVFNDSIVLQGAKIKLKNSFIESVTDEEGRYSIRADIGDVLQVSHIMMNDKEVTISDKLFDIKLKPNAEILAEVNLKVNKKNEEKVEGGFWKQKKDAIGYSHKQITEKDILPSAIYLSDVIRGRLSGVRVIGSGLDASYIIRGNFSFTANRPPLFVLDDVVLQEAPNFIDPQNIKSITVLSSLASTVRFGSEGRAGVFIIRTKNADFKNKNQIKSLEVKGNDYTESLPILNPINTNLEYINRLQSATSYDKGLEIYNKLLKENNLQSIPFYFDISDYFMKWNKDKAIEILTTVAEIAPKNVKALKALAYKLEELEELEKAKYLYEKIMVLRPKDAQSYRDLALIYSKVGMYNEAMDIYKSILSKSVEGVDFTGLVNVIENEIKAFVLNNRVHINYKDLPSEFLTAKFKKDLRIVFEWNDPNVEFELQFVNPKKKYFNWTHAIFENQERMLDEIKNGYHTEEFIIDDAAPGEWIINIECLSEEGLLNPTFLKYTVYTNYGLPNEKKDVKVIKLYDQKQKVTLDKLFYK